MATIDPNGSSYFWYDGSTSSVITNTPNAPIGIQNFWYNGQPQGFLLPTTLQFLVKPKYYAVLIGF
jgi:hypothetical protein